jgi:rod shape-determining protein MreD
MHLWGGQPDFLLTLSIIAGVFSTPTAGTITGFCAGLLHHASGTPYFGTYLFSRTLACFVASSVLVNRMQQNFLAALVGVFVGSVVADVVFIVSAPNFGAGAWLRMTLVGAVMNTLLAIPLALLLRLCGFRENRL